MKAYLFDLGNVILAVDHWRFCCRLAKEHRHLNEKNIYKYVFQEAGLNELFELGRFTEQGFYHALKTGLGVSLAIERVQELWCDIFLENPGMEPLLEALHSRARLILVSNTNVWHIEFIKKHFAAIRHFDELVLSHEVGIRKPDSKIFEAALSAAGANPEECLFIDDHEDNIKGAHQLGIPSVLFQYHGFPPANQS